MSKNPTPDQHGRFRVRRKGDTSAPVYSTTRFDPERHVIVPGPASDTYGAALPPKPSRRLDLEDPEQPPAGGDDTTESADGGEELNHEH